MELKQFIPQEDCLRCEVCCRFGEQHTVWAPKFTQDEVATAVEINKIPPLLFSQPTDTRTEHHPAQCINLLPCGHGFRCSCFTPHKNKCLIYAQRPFECQLYPFLLFEKDGQFFLAQDMKCPSMTSSDANALRAYKQYLQAAFKKQEYVFFLSQHRDLFSKYDSHDLEIVFSIHLDTFSP